MMSRATVGCISLRFAAAVEGVDSWCKITAIGLLLRSWYFLRCKHERLLRSALGSALFFPRLRLGSWISLAAPHVDRALNPAAVSPEAGALRGMFPAG